MRPLRVLSICTSAGLLDKAFIDAGFTVVPGCEIKEHKRRLYEKFVGGKHVCNDLADLPNYLKNQHYDLILGGPSCQAHTKLKAMNTPKFPDLTPLVQKLLMEVSHDAYLFENVVPIDLAGSIHTKRNAMNYPEHYNGHVISQSRPRWFTHSNNIQPPELKLAGSVNDLIAYPIVAGRSYGAKRGAIIQGWPEFSGLDEKTHVLQEALADGVPKSLATAWAHSVMTSLGGHTNAPS
ncbi:DNA cytosine methyltransferase [Photobacterium nomapromontoriensis]|uniref:DNA cytosine methyltransferase n=1 Tax=Photobacterium nomapromontoriensis TaxID=2910237 RepID=UPI003D131EC2